MQTQIGKDEPLEGVRDEILKLARNEEFGIFYSDSSSDSERALPEIQWQNSKDWKLFFSLAKSQGINLLIVEERAISEGEISEITAQIDDLENEEITPEQITILGNVKKLSKYADKLGSLKTSWVKDSTRYSLCFTTKWFDEFKELLTPYLESDSEEESHGQSKPIPKELAKKSVDEIAQDMLDFMNKEYGEDLDYLTQTSNQMFWESKGFHPYEIDSKGRLKMNRVEERAGKLLEKQTNKKEKEMIPDLIQTCAEWSKNNGLSKLTKANLKAFLAEKGDSLSKNSEDIVLFKVNAKLRD